MFLNFCWFVYGIKVKDQKFNASQYWKQDDMYLQLSQIMIPDNYANILVFYYLFIDYGIFVSYIEHPIL